MGLGTTLLGIGALAGIGYIAYKVITSSGIGGMIQAGQDIIDPIIRGDPTRMQEYLQRRAPIPRPPPVTETREFVTGDMPMTRGGGGGTRFTVR